MTAKLVVLISGNGSNLQAILDACSLAGAGRLPAEVVAVISNKPSAYGLERARKAGVPALVASRRKDQERAEADAALADLVAGYHPDWVVLAGWLRVLTNAFLQRFPGRVVNLHPALPGAFPGLHAIERAYAAARLSPEASGGGAGQIDCTGVMVHLVPDEGVDVGPVLAQQPVSILPDDTLESLEARIHAVEHRLLVDTLHRLILSA